MDYKEVIYTKEGHVATITLNRPEVLNAVTPLTLRELDSAIEEARRDEEVRVLVITGAGRGFCSGADVASGGIEIEQPPAGETGKRILEGRRMGFLLTRFPKPAIASVNGPAVGFGAELALQCDIRIASDKARFGWVFVNRGLVPDTGAGTYLLPRLVGLSRTCELLFSGDIINAAEAERIGLVSKVVPADQLRAATMELATRLAKKAPLALQLIKDILYRGLDRDLEAHLPYNAQAFQLLMQTEDYKEGIRSFLEKREPQFKGR